MLPSMLPYSQKIVTLGVKDVNASALASSFICMKNYNNGAVLISVGAHSGNAVAVTLDQAKNVAGVGSKTFSFTKYFKMLNTGDLWVAATATSDTFNIAANYTYVIPIRPAMFDVTNRFDCIQVDIAAGSASTILQASILLWGGPEGIDNNVNHIPTARAN
jgi:hypothetical protein